MVGCAPLILLRHKVFVRAVSRLVRAPLPEGGDIFAMSFQRAGFTERGDSGTWKIL